jgi:hypothetical protein
MNLDNMRRYGVEVEYISTVSRETMCNYINAQISGLNIEPSYYSDKSNTWRIKPDVSVREEGDFRYGHELVTPILSGEADMITLKKVIEIIEEYSKVNRSTGVHVHVDITGAEKLPLKKLMKFFAKYEKAIGKLLPESRRECNNSYCHDSFGRTENLVEVFNKMNTYSKRDLLTRSNFSGRGKWNFQNYSRHGSVENRAHSGTLNTAKIENWVRLTQGMVAMAFDFRGATVHENDTNYTYSVKHMLDALRAKKVISLSTKKFYIKRFKELNNAA